MRAIAIPYFHRRPFLIVPAGLVGGIFLGGLARIWMRWISTDPEFTWSGTLGIVIGFAVFGAVQSTVYTVRRKLQRSSLLLLVRVLGGIFSLQLFVAAGAVMFPTVLTVSLAVWRNKWKVWIRILLSLIGITFWVLIIYSEIVKNFGWSIATIGRILIFGMIYSAVVYALRPTISARI
ncbi:MAG: hypothetical protein HY050_05970 [Actinobacteria bacterium]|nr:hypothetical protein [Actinomycetota bacterium]